MLAAPLLLAAPVHAQQADEPAPGGFSLPPSRTAPPVDTRRQGPELDVFRAPATVAPPPIVAPTVTPPPVAVPVPSPAQSTTRQPTRPTETRPAPTPAPSTEPEPTNDSAPIPEALPAEPIVNQTAPAVTPPPAETPAPTASPASPASADTTPWGWIIGGLLALAAIAVAPLLRRRRSPVEAETVEAELVAHPLTAPLPPPAPPPAPVAPPPPPPAPVDTDRAWIDMQLVVTQARYSLMGVTIAYGLLLHNRGALAAQDVLVRGIIGNGGANQQALLDGFFIGETGLPLHAAVALAPGETLRLDGELRLAPNQIVPVPMGDRSLLIPIAAFDATYQFNDVEDDKGRPARAFIVGQDQEPPAERLAPLRLDQGPRQYRRPAARAAAELPPR